MKYQHRDKANWKALPDKDNFSYVNPWHNQRYMGSQKTYDTRGADVLFSSCGRGVIVEQYPDTEYHYIVDGILVNMLAGGRLQIIDEYCSVILDGIPSDNIHTTKAKDIYNEQAKEVKP